MSSKTLSLVRRITASPLLNIVVGTILLVSGASEIWDTIDAEFSLGAHHGAVVFGALHVFKFLPDLVEGL